MSADWRYPLPNRRMWRLVRRNFLVWRKLFAASVMVHFAEPLLILVGFGYGIGSLVGDVGEQSYLEFIAAGIVCYGAMNSASFEALYSAYTRMRVQRTWEGILNAPMMLDDILLGEWAWAAIKGCMAGIAILIVLIALQIMPLVFLPLASAVVALTAVTFASIGLAVNALARNYEFFSYYFTLFITPMMMLSGAFFPVSAMPDALQKFSAALPLTHAVILMRPLVNGELAADTAGSLLVLLAYIVVGLYLSAVLTRRRLLQ